MITSGSGYNSFKHHMAWHNSSRVRSPFLDHYYVLFGYNLVRTIVSIENQMKGTRRPINNTPSVFKIHEVLRLCTTINKLVFYIKNIIKI